jgi:hypothetical protein
VRVEHGDVSAQFISDVRNSQKIEWPLHFDFPFGPDEIQNFDQKEVRKLL